MEMLADLVVAPTALVMGAIWCFLLAQLQPRIPRVMAGCSARRMLAWHCFCWSSSC